MSKQVLEKLEKIEDRLDKIDVNVAVYNTHLEEHMRRTDLLETELKPVTRHVNMVQGAGKGLAVISLILGIIVTIIKLKG